MELLKIKLDFDDMTITWNEVSVPMKDINVEAEELFAIHDSKCMAEAMDRVKTILDAKYEPADLDEIVKGCKHLNEEEKRKLYHLLKNTKLYSMERWDIGKTQIMILNYNLTYARTMPNPIPYLGPMRTP